MAINRYGLCIYFPIGAFPIDIEIPHARMYVQRPLSRALAYIMDK